MKLDLKKLLFAGLVLVTSNSQAMHYLNSVHLGSLSQAVRAFFCCAARDGSYSEADDDFEEEHFLDGVGTQILPMHIETAQEDELVEFCDSLTKAPSPVLIAKTMAILAAYQDQDDQEITYKDLEHAGLDQESDEDDHLIGSF